MAMAFGLLAAATEIEPTGEAREAGEVDLLVGDLGVAIRHRRVLADEQAEASADHRRDRNVLAHAVIDAELHAREIEALQRRVLALVRVQPHALPAGAEADPRI